MLERHVAKYLSNLNASPIMQGCREFSFDDLAILAAPGFCELRTSYRIIEKYYWQTL